MSTNDKPEHKEEKRHDPHERPEHHERPERPEHGPVKEEKKEKYQPPIGQEVKSEVVKPSGEALRLQKEREASTPEAIAAARAKKPEKKEPEDKKK